MKKIFVLSTLFVLMSFSSTGYTNKERSNGKVTDRVLRIKHIDITVTATNGCTFHVVGDLNYTLFPPRINGFQGTVTIGGGSHCPHGTFTINWAPSVNLCFSRHQADSDVSLSFNTDVICEMTAVSWASSDQAVADALNNSELEQELIDAIKEGECN